MSQAGQEAHWFTDRIALLSCSAWPPRGQWAVLMHLGDGVAQRPLTCWVRLGNPGTAWMLARLDAPGSWCPQAVLPAEDLFLL